MKERKKLCEKKYQTISEYAVLSIARRAIMKNMNWAEVSARLAHRQGDEKKAALWEKKVKQFAEQINELHLMMMDIEEEARA